MFHFFLLYYILEKKTLGLRRRSILLYPVKISHDRKREQQQNSDAGYTTTLEKKKVF